jgi:hypothetical protein
MGSRLLLFAALVSTTAAAAPPGALAAPGAPARVVAYVAGVTARGDCPPPRCEWRAFDPGTGRDERVARLPGRPALAFWDERFRLVHFAAGGRVYRLRWAAGATARGVMPLPRGGEPVDLWFDAGSRALRYARLMVDEVEETLQVWEADRRRTTWRLVASRPCDCKGEDGPASAPGRAGRITLAALLDAQRIDLSRAGRDEEAHDGGATLPVPLLGAPGARLDVSVETGDTHHAVVPLVLVAADGTRHTLFGEADARPCDESRQIGFEEERGLLLVATEYFGGCGKVFDLRTGALVRALPRRATAAVWVPAPGR